MKKRVLFFAATASFALGCEGIIGANFDHGGTDDGGPGSGEGDGASSEGGGAGSGDALSSGDSPSDASEGASTSTDAGPAFSAACGDMSGYDPASPWPMGAYCPTRPNRSGAKALTSPHILWRFDYAPPSSGLEYSAGPAIAADGTVLVPGFFGVDGGAVVSAVSGIKDKVEVFRAKLPGANAGTPTIDKNGNFYVHCQGALAAFTKAGASLWTTTLKSNGAGDMPVILGDGTIAVLDGSQMAFIGSDGALKRTYSLGDAGLLPSFTGSIAVSATGVLYAAAAAKPGELNGTLHAVDSSAQMVSAPVTLSGEPTSSPSFDSAGNVVLTTSGGVFMFTPTLQGAGSTAQAVAPSQPHGALTGDTIFFPSTSQTTGPFSYDTVSQKLTEFPDLYASYASMVSVGVDLVIVRRNSSLSPPVRVEGWDLAAKSLWNVALDATGADMVGIAIGADGTIYVPLGPTLYAIGD